MPIYLYVKTHRKTGLKYLGKTVHKNPHTYPGSGRRWRAHLDKHGYDYDTEILFESESKEEIKEKGLYYSRLWNIVESDKWANLKEEACDGGAFPRTPELNKRVSEKLKGRVFSEEHRRKLSEANKGKYFHSEETKRLAAAKASAKLKGRKHTQEFKDYIGSISRGRKMTEDSKAKMRAAWTPERRAAQAERRRLQNLAKQNQRANSDM